MGTKRFQLTGGAPAGSGNQNWLPPAANLLAYSAPAGLITAIPAGQSVADAAWSLEARLMTSPDLAANGWTIQKFDSPYTPYARAGEVDWSIASVTANTYRSSLINGVLVMQLPIGSGTQIGKATDAAARSYVSHAWNSLDTDNNYAFLANTSTYLENGKQTFYCGIEGQKFVEVLATGPATFNVIRNPAITLPQHNMQKWIHYDGANAKCQGANALDARAHSSTVLSTANTAITVPTYAGVVFTPSSRQLCFLDSIRRETSYAFP